MANSTTFLTLPPAQRSGTEKIYIERYVDFSLENVASGSSIDVLKLLKGTILTRAGFASVTHQDTVTFALSVPTKSITVISATAHTADDEVTTVDAGAASGQFTTKLLDADDTLRVTIGAATASTAKVIFFAEYAVSDTGRNQ